MTYLISEEKIKKAGLLDDNLWGSYITPSIRLAQEKGLMTVTGERLYKKITALVESGQIKQQEFDRYKYLLDEYITPYLIWETVCEAVVVVSYKLKNQAVTQAQTDWTQNPTLKDLQWVRQQWLNNATFYAKRLADFLDAHCSEYPDYHTHNCGETQARRQYETGIYLGRHRGCCDIHKD